MFISMSVLETMGLSAVHDAGVGMMGKNSWWRGKDQSQLLLEGMGSASILLGVGGLGQCSFRNERDCSEFLGPSFWSIQEESEFLWSRQGLSVLS